MAPRFLKKLKTTVKDLVTKIGRALSGSSSKNLPCHIPSLRLTHAAATDDSNRAESTASPATEVKQDAKARARFPSTVPARERMTLDD